MSGLLDDLEPATVSAVNPPKLPAAPPAPKSLLDDLEPISLAPRAASGALGGGGLGVSEKVQQHRLAREGKVLRAMRSLHINSNTPATRQQVLPLVYDDVPPAIWPVAERSLAAHMARIVEHGLLA